MLKRLKRRRVESIEVEIDGLETPLLLRRSPRARRLSLQVSEARRGPVLTVPLYTSYAEADEFLSRHLAWLQARLAGLGKAVGFAPGAILPLRGDAHEIRFVGTRRGLVWVEAAEAQSSFTWPDAEYSPGGLPLLCVAGEEKHAPRRLRDWLKREAHADLKICVERHANRLGLEPKRIVVRDQTTRWGSCSATGALSFSWRLVLAPPYVLDYLAAHEVAHLKHMNHGPRFWATVRRTMPEHETARAWLRKHGASLHRYGA